MSGGSKRSPDLLALGDLRIIITRRAKIRFLGGTMKRVRLLTLPCAIIALAWASLAISSASSPPMNETINYSYDVLGRLVKVEHSGGVNNNVQARYTYDKADNRVNVNVTGAP
jgi:hypothetical protein